MLLTNVDFDKSIIASVKSFPKLEKVAFDHCSINYDAMKNLLEIKTIIKLRFRKTKISRKISEAICNANHIIDLSLSKSNYTDATILQFSNSKSLKSLNISGNKRITYDGVFKLVKVRKSKFLIRYDQENRITKNQINTLKSLGLQVAVEKPTINRDIQHMILR